MDSSVRIEKADIVTMMVGNPSNNGEIYVPIDNTPVSFVEAKVAFNQGFIDQN